MEKKLIHNIKTDQVIKKKKNKKSHEFQVCLVITSLEKNPSGEKSKEEKKKYTPLIVSIIRLRIQIPEKEMLNKA